MADRAQLDRWMTAAAEGDRGAIEPLFQALWPVVASYASRIVGDPTLGEDVAQETLVRLFRQIDRYDRSRDALTWTLAIATWQCRTARKQRQRRAEVAEPASDASINGASIAEHRELVREALATLGTLAPRDAEVITASITDDEALRDALEPATFRKRLERAVARLRLSWRSRHGTL